MTLHDSQSMLFTDYSWESGRQKSEATDGSLPYGCDYNDAIKAFYALSGSQLVLPAMGLGKLVEWSLQVTAEGYLALMDRFKVEETPLSVTMLDMDWHWVYNEIVRKSGFSG
ncbi:hypothetical protein V1504DRAFT_470715 [Lipomyces starkeyi]